MVSEKVAAAFEALASLLAGAGPARCSALSRARGRQRQAPVRELNVASSAQPPTYRHEPAARWARQTVDDAARASAATTSVPPTDACAWHPPSEAILSDSKRLDWAARTIALLAVIFVLAGGLLLLNAPNRERRTVIATSCSEFEADAGKLFDKGDTAVLTASFASGDHVHLAIDFRGVGYVWELTGALATRQKGCDRLRLVHHGHQVQIDIHPAKSSNRPFRMVRSAALPCWMWRATSRQPATAGS